MTAATLDVLLRAPGALWANLTDTLQEPGSGTAVTATKLVNDEQTAADQVRTELS
jgi:hypothetical protein